MWCVLLLLVGSFGRPATPVDRIELNHTPHYSQVILWRWSHDYQRYDAAGWWLVNPDQLEHAPTQHGPRWLATDKAGQQYTTRSYIERWTEYDPERANATFFPEGTRCFR